MIMKRFVIPVLAILCLANSCLFENDMAYPVVDDFILSFEVEGQKSVTIDKDSRTVHVELSETADISNLKVTSVVLSDNAQIIGGVPDFLDLSDTLSIDVKVYESKTWRIYASQLVARYINVENQIGEAELDLASRTAIVYVSDAQEISNLLFYDLKLAPEGTVIRSTSGYDADGEMFTQECEFPMYLDCVHPRTFLMYYDGPIEQDKGLYEWKLKVLKKKLSQQVTEVRTWCYHAKVYGTYSGTGEPVVEFRKASDSEWIAVPDATFEGVGVTADILSLEPGTEYVVRIGLDGEYSSEQTFVTDMPEQLYNMSFDEWYEDGNVWYPYSEGSNPPVWDSANKGAATFIGSSTVPEESFVVKGKAAKLESKFAVIAFAAGNIYPGKFGKVNGIGAELDWGTPFSGRPTSLTGYYSYFPMKIDKADDSFNHLLGETDKCQVLVCLTDWDAPFKVNTTLGQFVDFDNDPAIIAFGKMETSEDTGGQYRQFTLPLEYRDRTRKPKYIVIACCASYLGDYFTGGIGSTMFIDEFEFIYE